MGWILYGRLRAIAEAPSVGKSGPFRIECPGAREGNVQCGGSAAWSCGGNDDRWLIADTNGDRGCHGLIHTVGNSELSCIGAIALICVSWIGAGGYRAI